jgi:hypothetical protein
LNFPLAPAAPISEMRARRWPWMAQDKPRVDHSFTGTIYHPATFIGLASAFPSPQCRPAQPTLSSREGLAPACRAFFFSCCGTGPPKTSFDWWRWSRSSFEARGACGSMREKVQFRLGLLLYESSCNSQAVSTPKGRRSPMSIRGEAQLTRSPPRAHRGRGAANIAFTDSLCAWAVEAVAKSAASTPSTCEFQKILGILVVPRGRRSESRPMIRVRM